MTDGDDHIMLDLETLGTDPGATIVAIGAVRFDVADGLGTEFGVSVSVEDCQAEGLEIDASTLEWWLSQSADARAQLEGGCSLGRALRDLAAFIRETNPDALWANSPAFDCAILRAAFDAVGRNCPWAYYIERDYRTLRETLPAWPDREQETVSHDALDDARYQAECLVYALQSLEDGVSP